jgi:hypothetical protein
MQNLQTIKLKLDQIQQRIDTALALVTYGGYVPHRYELRMKLREAQAEMVRVRSRMRTVMNDSHPTVSVAPTPARPPLDISPGSKAGRTWAICDRCRQYMWRDQLATHMWQMHRADIDGRTKDLADIAAELQQRDNDLYRDD